MKNEIWKDIVGYEGLYQVSNLGRIKRLEKITKWHTKHTSYSRLDKEKILTQEILKNGYPGIRLSKNGIKKRIAAHRIIAKAFLPNPENKPCINHKDGDRTNNNIENLEWCTYSENNIHEWRVLKKQHYNKKPVVCVETNEFFGSMVEAANQYNCTKHNIFYSVKTGGTALGKHWRYANV